MADGSDLEKTEAPSQRRLEKAREEGRVPRSRELSTFLLFASAAVLFSSYGPVLFTQLQSGMRVGLSISRADAFNPGAMGQRLFALGLEALGVLAPLFGLLIVVAIFSGLCVGGWTLSTQAFLPDFGRVNPLSGLGRMLSKHGLVELLKAVGKTLVLGLLGAWLMWDMRAALLGLGDEDVAHALVTVGTLLARGFIWMCAGLALIAAADVPIQWLRHRDQLKMTRQEVVDEHREMDGDPKVKARIRSLQRAIARRRMMAAVPKADVVVVNPTHYAVALVYNESMRAPRVVAKGTDLIALKIREIASEHQVPILDAPPLARALNRHSEIGQEIPSTLYEAVALVMAYVFQLRRYKTYGGALPLIPSSLPVPDALDPHAEAL